MAARTFVISKGRICELGYRVENSDPGTSGLLLAYYKGTIEANATLEAHTSKTSVDASNTECDFTNYAVTTLANVAYATSGVEAYITADDVVILSAGGTTNNTITRAILYYAANTASPGAAIPLCHYQFDVTTDGTDLTFDIPASGLYRTG